MASRPPSPEELVDLAWMLDSAVVLRQRRRALEAANRLLDALLAYDEAMDPCRRRLDAAIARTLHDASLTLMANLVSLLHDLRRGGVRHPIQLRHQVEQLVDDEAMAGLRPASRSGVD